MSVIWVAPRHRSAGAVLQAGDTGAAVEELQSMLALYGYGVEITGAFDRQTEDRGRQAFQRHFRPRSVDGVADHSTIDTLRSCLLASARAVLSK